jgi:hypothetical protein
MAWFFILILFLCVSCGQSVCILGQGQCPDSSVSTPEKKALEVSASTNIIYSNTQNGTNFATLTISNGTASYTVSIPSTTTVAHLVDPNNSNNQVKTVTTSLNTVSLYANTGVTTDTQVSVTVSDSSSPVVNKYVTITIKP